MPPRKSEGPPLYSECIDRPVLMVHSRLPGAGSQPVDWLAILLERTPRGQIPGLTNRATLEAFQLQPMPNGYVTVVPERVRVAQGSIKDRQFGVIVAALRQDGQASRVNIDGQDAYRLIRSDGMVFWGGGGGQPTGLVAHQDDSRKRDAEEGLPAGSIERPAQSSRTSYEATASGAASAASDDHVGGDATEPTATAPPQNTGGMGKRVRKVPQKYKSQADPATPVKVSRAKKKSAPIARSSGTIDEVLVLHPKLKDQFTPNAERITVTSFGSATTDVHSPRDDVVGRPIIQDSLQAPPVPPLTPGDLAMLADPDQWPSIRVGEIFKLGYASRRRTSAPASLSSKWQATERRADQPHVAVCGQFGIPYGGKGATAEDSTVVEIETYCWSLAAAALSCFRCGQPVSQDDRTRPHTMAFGGDKAPQSNASMGSSCWCKVQNDLLVTAPNRSLEAGYSSVTRSSTSNPDGSHPVAIYAKIPRQRDEDGWLDGLADSVDAKGAPVTMFVRIRESFVDPETKTPQCDVYEGFVRVLSSTTTAAAASAAMVLQQVGTAPAGWGATGGPASGSLLYAPDVSAELNHPVLAPATAEKQSPKPRSTPTKGKRRDSLPSPAGSAGGVLRICFNCNFFLPLRDFADPIDQSGACTGCRDTITSPAVRPGRKKRTPASAPASKGKGAAPRKARKGKAPAPAYEQAPVDEEGEEEEEIEEKTLHYWGVEQPKEELAAVAAIWNDEDMDDE